VAGYIQRPDQIFEEKYLVIQMAKAKKPKKYQWVGKIMGEDMTIDEMAHAAHDHHTYTRKAHEHIKAGGKHLHPKKTFKRLKNIREAKDYMVSQIEKAKSRGVLETDMLVHIQTMHVDHAGFYDVSRGQLVKR
jgi:hypothetical protein